MQNDQSQMGNHGNEGIPDDVNLDDLGACSATDCECKKFVYENGSNKCGRDGCGHNYNRHRS